MIPVIERGLVVAAMTTVAVVVLLMGSLLLPESFRGAIVTVLTHHHADVPTIDEAEQAADHHDRDLALRLAREALLERSGDAAVAARAGAIAARLRDDAAAEKYYLEGQVDDPTNPWNFAGLAYLRIREGHLESADAQLRSAIGAAPDTPLLHYQLGEVELRENLSAAAYNDFQTELKRSPGYAPAKQGRAAALARLRSQGLANADDFKPRNAPLFVAKPSPAPETLAIESPPPAALPPAGVAAAPSPSPVPTSAPSPKPQARARPPQRHAAHHPRARRNPRRIAASASPAAAPVISPIRAGAVASDARSYLLELAQDFSFTRALPAVDPDVATKTLAAELKAAGTRKDVDRLLRDGTAALESGRLTLAAAAFTAASQAAPGDWRGPYFAGLAAQASGDAQRARSQFTEAAHREARAEPYTSLAVLDLAENNAASAGNDATRAIDIDPSYVPGLFTAGVVALVNDDIPAAKRRLSAAVSAGGAPPRASEFLDQITGSEKAAAR
jgi:hypothetical protein